MSTSDSDPFAIGPPPPPSPSPPPTPPDLTPPNPTNPNPTNPDPTPDPPPRTPRDRAVVARMVVVSVAALATSVLAPPVGVVLGVLALGLVVRARSSPSGLRVAMGLVAGAAMVLGVSVSLGAWVLRAELDEYRTCTQGANTRLAEQGCRDVLDAALRERLGVAPG